MINVKMLILGWSNPLNCYKHELMETLNSVVRALTSLLHTLHCLSLDCAHAPFVALTDTFFNQPMCELSLVLMASTARVKFYFSVDFQ